MIYAKTQTTTSKSDKTKDEKILIDIRDKANVFFFYMIIGYENDPIRLRDPDDKDLSKPLDSDFW